MTCGSCEMSLGPVGAGARRGDHGDVPRPDLIPRHQHACEARSLYFKQPKKNGTEATKRIGHCANLIAAAWVRATVRRGAHSIISVAATFIRVHSAESQCLLLSGSTGRNAEGRNVSVTGPVKVTAETQRGAF